MGDVHDDGHGDKVGRGDGVHCGDGAVSRNRVPLCVYVDGNLGVHVLYVHDSDGVRVDGEVSDDNGDRRGNVADF